MKKLVTKPFKGLNQIVWFCLIYVASILGFGLFSLLSHLLVNLLKH